MDHQPAKNRVLDSKDVARKLKMAGLALAVLVGFTLVLAVVAAILNLIEDPPPVPRAASADAEASPFAVTRQADAVAGSGASRERWGVEPDAGTGLEDDPGRMAGPEAGDRPGDAGRTVAGDAVASGQRPREPLEAAPVQRGGAGDDAGRASDEPSWIAATRAPSDLRDAEFGFDSTGFELERDELEVSGIHGILCNPGTGSPEGGLSLVVGSSEGEEIVSPSSAPDGSYALGLEPGILYRQDAVLLPGGERFDLQGTGLSFRIWSGRNLEVNVCDFEERPSEAATERRPEAAPETPASLGPPGFPTRIFGLVADPVTGRAAVGFRVVLRTSRGDRVVGGPSDPDGFYQIPVEPGLRYEPVEVLAPDGGTHVLRSGLGGFRLQPGESVRIDVRDYE